ncbi:MAG: hypothetical protein ACRD5L_04205, partial [Bryobacteraceae bacterium]
MRIEDLEPIGNCHYSALAHKRSYGSIPDQMIKFKDAVAAIEKRQVLTSNRPGSHREGGSPAS